MTRSLDSLRKAALYIPRAGTFLAQIIDAGSGIVGRPDDDGGLTIYYEGNRPGFENLREYESRVRSAAGRLFENYPTTAVLRLPPESAGDLCALIQVGEIGEEYQIHYLSPEARAQAHAYGRTSDHGEAPR